MTSDLKFLLQNYETNYKEEKSFKKRMLQFLESTKDPFIRENYVGHFTASCLLLNRQEDKALLMLHKKLDRWLQLGGHCDGDTDILNVAVKEAMEESGLDCIVPAKDGIFDLDIHLIPNHKDTPEHFHFDVRFLLKSNNDSSIKKNSESKELRWIEQDGLIPTNDLSVLRLLEKWKRQSD